MRKRGSLFLLLICLTIAMPTIVAFAASCNWVNQKAVILSEYKPIQVEGDHTYHKVKMAYEQICQTHGDTRINRAYTFEEPRRHDIEHGTPVSGTKQQTGGKKIDSVYHYIVYTEMRKCACGFSNYFTWISSKKQLHKFDELVSMKHNPKTNKYRITRKCVCGAKFTETR